VKFFFKILISQSETDDKEISILDYNFKFPFTNNYKTLKTIGLDRLVLVTAAFDKFPNKNVLVIDAGTCITYDYIGSNKIYQGGAISPGLRMSSISLNKQTKNLPLLDPKLPDTIIGNSTKNSIHSGVVFGIINEIEGVINQYNKEFVDLTVVFTGGDANFLCKQFKISIFANSNFLLEGLNFLLEYKSN
jgi:type III pantothenate kinase